MASFNAIGRENQMSVDTSGAKLCQQQGTWCCHPSRVDKAQSWRNDDGVASADALIKIGRASLGEQSTQTTPATQPDSNKTRDKEYPPSDANKIADACKQIGAFRDLKGAGQSEPIWYDCLGVIGHCQNGAEFCQEWSSSHPEYDSAKTAKKLEQRMEMGPTTCAQFKKTNPAGCVGCARQCRSPITLGYNNTLGIIDKSAAHLDSSTGIIETPASESTAASTYQKVPPTDDEVIALLAAMSPMEYDRIRLEKAKELGVQVKTLDNQVKKERNEKVDDENLPFPEVEPYPNPIEPALLFGEISLAIRRFVLLNKEQADAIVLWVSHTYLIDDIDISPLLLIDSPERGCGKTLLETLLSYISYRPLAASHASASALFRSVELWKPTIFFDEADTFFRDNFDLHNMINAGYKRGSVVLRSEAAGDNFIPRMFSVYSAKCIAGIALEKHLPDSTMSRGIVIKMRRKMPHEKIERLRHAGSSIFDEIASKLTRFALDYSRQVRLARPALPEELSDRNQDNWESLFAIAECAGPEWLQRATEAALKLSSANEASVSTGNELLADIHHIFESGKNPKKLSTVDLINALTKDDESPWKTYNRGKEITARQLAKLLAVYGIKSKTVRINQGHTPKGYDADQFADAFARYLAHSPKLSQQRNDSPEANSSMALGAVDKTQHSCNDPTTGVVADTPTNDCVNNEYDALDAVLDLNCGDVADKTKDDPDEADRF
jgi:hypothetical protein